jgi:iron complex transport system substrate-binding protein
LLVLLPGAALARSVTDATGRTVDVPDRVERILPAGPPAAVLLYTLAPAKLLGWVHAPGSAARPFLIPAAAALPEIGPLMRGGTVDRAMIAGLHPDLILDIGTVTPRYADQAKAIQAETGIPSLLFDGGLAETAMLYRRLGPLIGAEARGEALAAAADRILGALAAAVARPAASPMLRAYFGRGPDGLTTASSRSVNGESLKLLGLANVADGVGGTGLTKVTRDQVLAWQPEIVLTVDATFGAALRSDPAWAALPAVRAGRVLVSPAQPFGWIDEPPSVNRLLGLAWVGHLLYPEAIPEEPRAAARRFYALFYGVEPSADQLAQLLP